MRMNAVLSNPKHPEYGQFTVPLPIPHNQYDGIMEALNAMDMGDPLARDCQMDEILGEYPILKRLEGKPVNIDELDYLAKRLDSFCCALEDAQFQGAAVSYDYPSNVLTTKTQGNKQNQGPCSVTAPVPFARGAKFTTGTASLFQKEVIRPDVYFRLFPWWTDGSAHRLDLQPARGLLWQLLFCDGQHGRGTL